MLYTFYPCDPDGSSQTFEAVELPGDRRAGERAELILRDHASCAYVAVWEGDRRVLTLARRALERDARAQVAEVF